MVGLFQCALKNCGEAYVPIRVVDVKQFIKPLAPATLDKLEQFVYDLTENIQLTMK